MRQFALIVLLSSWAFAADAGPADPFDACELKSGDAQIAACTRFIEAQGTDEQDLARAYRNRGIAHYEAKHYDQAIADLDKVLTMYPDSTAAHFHRALALDLTDREVEAIPDYDALLAADPKDPHRPDEASILCDRGVAYLKKGGEDARGFADIDRAIALKPADLSCYEMKADAYEKQGNVEQQMATLDKMISVQPNGDKALSIYTHRAKLHLKRGDNDKALADYTRALEIDPNATWPLFARAVLLEKMGRLDQAIADFDKLISLEPKDEVYARHRADLKTKKDGAAPQ